MGIGSGFSDEIGVWMSFDIGDGKAHAGQTGIGLQRNELVCHEISSLYDGVFGSIDVYYRVT